MKESNAFSAEELSLPVLELFLSQLTPRSYPKRHNIHKYWGKKPANVFRELIETFSKEGETVLDPFSGSGVTAVEAALLKRNGIGVDLNPFAKELGEAIGSCTLKATGFENIAKKICDDFTEVERTLYASTCRHCASEVIPHSFSWEKADFVGLSYRCKTCKASEFVEPNEQDIIKSKFVKSDELNFPDASIINGWETQKLLRAGLVNFSELFTDRNLNLAANLLEAINKVDDINIRTLLRVTFTSNLAQCTKMIVDYKNAKNGGGPSWKINCYWLPSDWQELNVLHYFKNRVSKTISAIKEMSSLTDIGYQSPFYYNQDSRDLSNVVADNSVDYILTDPPYGGEGIQYGELSMLWNIWLGLKQNLDLEVAENPYRSKTNEDYGKALSLVMKECYRVLKPGRWMSLTFNNKDKKTWNSLLVACREAGFILKTVSQLKRRAPSLTEHTMNDAPKSDMLIQFQKPSGNAEATSYELSGQFDLASKTYSIARHIIHTKDSATTEEILNSLTVEWLTHYYSRNANALDNYGQITVNYVNRMLNKSDLINHGKAINNKKFDNFIWKLDHHPTSKEK